MIDLKGLFGQRYKIAHDPAWKYEKPELRDQEHFYYIIPAKCGEFYVDGGMIGFQGRSSRMRRKFLREVPGARLHQWGDEEFTAIFPVESFPIAAKIAGARRRRVLSEKQRKIQVQRLTPYRFQKGEFSRSTERLNEPEIVEKGMSR